MTKETCKDSPLESVVQPAADFRKLKDWAADEYSLALNQKREAKELRCYSLAQVHDSYAKAMAKVLGKIEQFTQERQRRSNTK